MSALGTDRRTARRRREGPCPEPAPSLFDGLGGEPTLDEVLSGVWEGLAAHHSVACPVCAGDMSPEYGAHARPIAGRCASCGTHLS
jgi:hypothetical protein